MEETVLRKQFEAIRDETRMHANTATRIGEAFLALLSHLSSSSQKEYLSRINDDTAEGLITFLKGIVVDGLATLAELLVKGDSTFTGRLSSEEFISGFLDGKGWAIFPKEETNAAGETEQKWTGEFDDLTVRGQLKVYEMIISQLLGENDNRVFTGMMEVDHYDAATGRIYLDTDGGKLYNTFRKDDYIMVQQYNGLPSEDNDYTVTKRYELIVTEAGCGSTDDGENRLDWVTFKNFTTTATDGTPDKLIAQGDTLVRVDNLSDEDRKGIVTITSVGSKTPYMDIIYALKTDPDNALKGRIGNLEGVKHHLFGWLQSFGAYLINLYAVGDFRLRQTGESLDTKIEMLRSVFATQYKKLSYDLTEEDNYLKNATFTEDMEGWTSDDTVKYIAVGDDTLLLNRSTIVQKDSYALTEEYDGRNMLHLCNATITQANADITKPATHKVYSVPTADSEETTSEHTEEGDTLYLSVKLLARTAGTLTAGFASASQTDEDALPYGTVAVAKSDDWQTFKWQGTWDGTGDFTLGYTGDCYVALLALTSKPLDDYKKEVSTSIEQTAENIRLLGRNVNKVKGTVTELGFDLDAANERITIYADKTDELSGTLTNLGLRLDADEENITLYADKYNSLNDSVSNLGIRLDADEENIKLYADKVSANETAISQLQVDTKSISSSVTSVQADLETAKARIEEVATIAEEAGNAETYSQSGNPWSSWNSGTEHNHVGAVWYNTSDGHTYRYIGYDNTNTWEDITDIQDTATYILQNKDKLSLVAAAFDSSGNLTNTSGLVTTAYASSMYATKTEYDDLGNRLSEAEASITANANSIGLCVQKTDLETGYVKKAEIIAGINNEDQTEVKISADKIQLEGYTTINSTFSVDENGSITATGGRIGCFKIDGSTLADSAGDGSLSFTRRYQTISLTGDTVTKTIIPQFQIDFSETVFTGQIKKEYEGQYYPVPCLAGWGHVTVTTSKSVSISGVINGAKPTVSRSDTGIYTITHGNLANLKRYYFLQGVGATADSTAAPVKATVTNVGSTSFTVWTSDDNSRNDGSFYFMILVVGTQLVRHIGSS